MALIDPDTVPRFGVPSVDSDHVAQARLVNDCVEAAEAHVAGRLDVRSVVARLDALYAQTRAHFEREEAMMRASSYPEYEEHRAEHERVLEELDAEERHFKDTDDAERLRTWLAKVPAWFEEHVATMDRATARFALEWGLSS
jgi:hemerythrin